VLSVSISGKVWFSDLPITRDHPIHRSGHIPIPSAHYLWYSHKFFAGM
jgi:hypothetical protein